MSLFDIVIINWNSGPQLKNCIASIAQALKDGLTLGKLVVVDNASADNSLDGLDEFALPLVIVRNRTNRGFGAACNQGVAVTESPIVLFLNPDTLVTTSSFAVPLAFLADPNNWRYAACGIQLVGEDGHIARSCARFPTAWLMVFSAVGLSKLFPTQPWDMIMTDWDHRTSRDVDHVIGAAYFVRRDALCKVGGFDERFFVYLEDVDLSRRLHDAGYAIRYLTDAQAMHIGGGASRQIAGRRLYYSLRSRLQYAVKHCSRAGAIAVFAVTLLIEPIARSVQALLERSRGALQALAEAYRLLWPDLPAIWRSQNQTQPKAR